MTNRVRRICRLLAAFTLAAAFPTFTPSAKAQTVTWKQLSPKKSPSARAFTAMAYDPVSKKVVLFGGYDGTTHLNETWTFDGTTWNRLKLTAAPSGRAGASMAFDRATRKLVLFGGFDGTHYLGDTWLWDGSASTWTQAHPKSSPTSVTGPMLFTDPKNGNADAFGGFDGRLYQSSTWRWTGSTWKQLHPANIPGARSIAVAALTARERMSSSLGDWVT